MFPERLIEFPVRVIALPFELLIVREETVKFDKLLLDMREGPPPDMLNSIVPVPSEDGATAEVEPFPQLEFVDQFAGEVVALVQINCPSESTIEKPQNAMATKKQKRFLRCAFFPINDARIRAEIHCLPSERTKEQKP